MLVSQLAMLVLLGSLWGASFLFIKLGLASFEPATIMALRLLGSAPLLYLMLRQQGHRLPTSWRSRIDLVLVGVVGMVIPFTLIAWGEQFIASSLAAIIVATTPLFTLLLVAAVTRSEPLGVLRVLGVLVGFGGVLVAVGVDDLHLADASTQGQIAIIGAALCYATVAIYSRRAFQGWPALVPATGTMAGGALVALPLALLLDGPPTLSPQPTALGGVVGLTLLSTALAYILYFWILERLGAARTTMVTYLIPSFALVYGWLWLSEPIGLHTLVGLGLVCLGIFIANSAPKRLQSKLLRHG